MKTPIKNIININAFVKPFNIAISDSILIVFNNEIKNMGKDHSSTTSSRQRLNFLAKTSIATLVIIVLMFAFTPLFIIVQRKIPSKQEEPQQEHQNPLGSNSDYILSDTPMELDPKTVKKAFSDM